jgi:hypothetical protein
MDNELKQKWIAALRSGEYKQGIGQLIARTHAGEVKHCCLGVLAELAGIDREELQNKEHLDSIDRQDILGSWNSRIPGEPAYEAHFDSTHTTAQRRLAAMNDNGCTFCEIADEIERTL